MITASSCGRLKSVPGGRDTSQFHTKLHLVLAMNPLLNQWLTAVMLLV